MFIDSGLRRACAVLGIKLTHSAPGRPAGRGKIERYFRTVRDQFLVEIATAADGVGTRVDTLAELNSLFTAWVEQVYHQRVHSETEQAPLARFLAAGPAGADARPQLLAEAFRWGEWRTVTKTATVSLHGNLYEVDPALAGSKVELVFDPFDLTDITVPAPRPARREGDPVQDRPARPPQGRRRHPTTGDAHRDRLPAAARGPADPRPGRTAPLRPTHRPSPDRADRSGRPRHPSRQPAARQPATDHDGLRYDADLLTLAARHTSSTAADPRRGDRMSLDKLCSYYGFTRTPFRRDLAPGMLHRHAGHAEAVARIPWCIGETALGVITGEVGAGKTVALRAALAELDASRLHRDLPAEPRRRRPRHLHRAGLRPRRRPPVPHRQPDRPNHGPPRRRETRTRTGRHRRRRRSAPAVRRPTRGTPVPDQQRDGQRRPVHRAAARPTHPAAPDQTRQLRRPGPTDRAALHPARHDRHRDPRTTSATTSSSSAAATNCSATTPPT